MSVGTLPPFTFINYQPRIMTTLDDMTPQPGERAILLGMTGSGKTTLAKALLMKTTQPIIVFDYKHTFSNFRSGNSSGFVYAGVPEEIPGLVAGGYSVVYRPAAEAQNLETSERVLRWVYLQGDICLYIDDLHIVCDNGVRFPPSLRHISTLGREKLITAIYSTQRPVSIPRIALSEATHNFVFMLNLVDDRQIAAGVIGEEAKEQPGKYEFWYKRGDSTDPPAKYSIALSGGK